MWGPDPVANRVEVGVEDLSPDQEELLNTRYGAAMLMVVERSLPRPVIGNR